MHSFSWNTGQWQKGSPPSQSSQASSQVTQSPMWNQQPGIADYSCHQRTLNHGTQPPQRSHLNFHNVAYSNRQWSNWQTSAVPHQTVSFEQPVGGVTIDQKMLHDNAQNPFLKMQNVNHRVVNGPHVATQQDFHMNSGIISPSSHVQPNIMKANTTYTQQDVATQWKQQCFVSNPQNFTNLKPLSQNVNAEPIKPISACTTTATSLPHEQVVSTSNSMSLIAHKRQSTPNQYYKQNGPIHEFTPLTPPPTYEMAINSSTSTSSQDTQHHAINFKAIQYKGQEAVCRFLSRTNEPVDTQEQAYRRQIIARIVDDLRNSFPAASDGCCPGNNGSPYRDNQFASTVRMTDPNQNNQPAKVTVTESCNSFASLLRFEQTSPKVSHSIMSRTQNSLNAPQPNPVPRNVVQSRGDASQSMNRPKNISLQTSKTKSPVENSHQMPEKLQMLSTVKGNDNSIHLSPGRTGIRAVAVVQPLSQEGNHAASSHVSSGIINPSADENSIIHSVASRNGSAVSSSDLAGHEDKQSCSDDAESELSVDMQVDHYGAPTTQQSVSKEVNQSGEDQSENRTDSEVLELSSVPTIPWRFDALANLIQEEEIAQKKHNRNLISNTADKLIFMFWNNKVQNLITTLQSGWYPRLITRMKKFFRKYETPDAIVLSQVKGGFETQLRNFHILKDNEAYSEPPYNSSWLNVNELDEIDKEFGFPSSLKHHIHMAERHSQPDQGCTADSIHAQTVSNVPNNVQSQSALEPVDSGEGSLLNSTVEDTPAQVASPKETRTVDSTDPHYSFDIKVLPPEEARVIFEQVQSEMEKGQRMERQLNISKLGKESDIEEVCCISRWVEINMASNGLPLSPCDCKTKHDLKNCTDHRDMEEMAGQNEDDLTANSKSLLEGENQVKRREVINNEIMIYDSRSELCNDHGKTNSLIGNGQKYHINFEKESKDQISLHCNQLSIPHTKENEEKGLPSSKTEIQLDRELESTGGTQSCASISSNKDVEILPRSESEESCHTSNLEENCGQANYEGQPPQIAAEFTHSGNHEITERKRKRPSSHDRCFPVQSSKRKPPFDMDSLPSTFREVTENDPSASNVKTVQLVLFGSTAQETCGVIGGRERHNSSSEIVSFEWRRPPEVLFVNLNPMRRKPCESIAMGEHSVKHRHEQWGKRFQLSKSRHQSKLKTQKCSFSSLSGVSLKRTGAVDPTNTENLPIASKMRIWSLNGKAKCRRGPKKRVAHSRKKRVAHSPKKRVPHSDRLKQREQMMKQNTVVLKQRADQERSNGENESPSDVPLREKIVLRFSVLPNFKDGCHEREEVNDTDPNKPVLKNPHKDSTKTVVSVKGIWQALNPEKKHCAVGKTPFPGTAGLFQKFQKKYMEKRPSIDE